MVLDLTRFAVSGLYGDRDIDIPVKESRLLLVGANGIGKSTVVSLLFLLLSRQWRRLLDYNFESLTVDIAGRSLTISRREIEGGLEVLRRQTTVARRLLPGYVIQLLDERPDIWDQLQASTLSQEQARLVARQLGIPASRLDQLRSHWLPGPPSDEGRPLADVDAWLKKAVRAQLLYLPTYRRIEKDLKAVFPELEENLRHFRRRTARPEQREQAFVELVEFGMEDVEETVNRTLASLKETARAELNNLAGSYLRDVIRGEAQTYDARVIAKLGADDVTRILNRVEEETLSDEDKVKLRDVIDRVKASGGPSEVDAADRYIAHFFARLVAVHQALIGKEESMARFAEVCARYLRGKEVGYDDKAYGLRVLSEGGHPLELRHLSSGEKQIVSLFSHLYLATTSACVVLIDEPELSLAVEWQRTLLPDIWNSGRCAFLCAVTHSPFIFDNEFDVSARDLREFIRPL